MALTNSSGAHPSSRAALPTALPMPMGPSTWRMETLSCNIFRNNSRIRDEFFTHSPTDFRTACGNGNLTTFVGKLASPIR